jgi:hypothetical protein
MSLCKEQKGTPENHLWGESYTKDKYSVTEYWRRCKLCGKEKFCGEVIKAHACERQKG